MLHWIFLSLNLSKLSLLWKKKIASLWIVYLNIMILPFIPGMINSRLYNLELVAKLI